MRFERYFSALAAAVLCLSLLAGCQQAAPETSQTTTAAPIEATHTVRFIMGGQVLSQQQVREGDFPQAVTGQVSGLTFRFWQNAQGEAVDPAAQAVTGDTDYIAAVYPQLTEHAPFLFADDGGFLRPDEALTADELVAALEALASQDAKAHFPGMPIGSTPMTHEGVRYVLERFFDGEQVAAAYEGITGKAALRGEFALVMCRLLGRGIDETVKMEDAALPMDMTAARTDSVALLEASMAHTPDAEGIAWASLELPAGHDPGFVNVDGWLYYVQEDGYLLRNGDVGVLHFDENGRYTSGDAELDAQVAGIWKQILEENPGLERLDQLRKGFEYCRDAFKYLRKSAYACGATGWEIEDAKEMFTSGRGNCYNYAAAFWAVARGLGYEAKAISGTVTQTIQPHGWVEIDFDGKTYIFDCEWEMAYRVKQNRYDMDMFMLTLQEGKFWNYQYK